MAKTTKQTIKLLIIVLTLFAIIPAYAKDEIDKGKTYVKVFTPESASQMYHCDEIPDLEVVDQFGNPWLEEFKQYDPIISASAVCNSGAYDVTPLSNYDIYGLDFGGGYIPYNVDGSPIQGMRAKVYCVEPGNGTVFKPEEVYLYCLVY